MSGNWWLSIDDDRTLFAPGEKIVGRCGWVLDEEPDTVEVRLFWYTDGIGTRDVEIVASITLDRGRAQDERPFELTLPDRPYSLSGRLVSILWAVELVIEPGERMTRHDLVVSPAGTPIELGHVPEPPGEKKGFSFRVRS